MRREEKGNVGAKPSEKKELYKTDEKQHRKIRNLFSKGSSRQQAVMKFDENYAWTYTGIKCTKYLCVS